MFDAVELSMVGAILTVKLRPDNKLVWMALKEQIASPQAVLSVRANSPASWQVKVLQQMLFSEEPVMASWMISRVEQATLSTRKYLRSPAEGERPSPMFRIRWYPSTAICWFPTAVLGKTCTMQGVRLSWQLNRQGAVEQVTVSRFVVYMVMGSAQKLLELVMGVVTQLTMETVDPCAMRLQGQGPIRICISSALGLKLLPLMQRVVPPPLEPSATVQLFKLEDTEQIATSLLAAQTSQNHYIPATRASWKSNSSLRNDFSFI